MHVGTYSMYHMLILSSIVRVSVVAGMPTVKEPCFITEQVYGPGKHIFEVEMLEPWQDHDNFIPLSHLIWY
jgi:hypothetical protein